MNSQDSARQRDTLTEKAQQFLRSAAVLIEIGDYDSCVSRAYFAMFYAAQAALLAERGRLPEQGMRTAFAERFVASGRLPRRASESLNRAYDEQQLADYSHQFATTEAEAERTLGEAEAFVNSLTQMVREGLAS